MMIELHVFDGDDFPIPEKDFDNIQAEREGWGIFECGGSESGPYKICKDEDPPEDDTPDLENDDGAWAHVAARALEGSAYHTSALLYIHEFNPIEWRAILEAHPELRTLNLTAGDAQ